MYYRDRTTGEYPLDRWTVMQRDPVISEPIVWDDAICAALDVWPVYPRPTQIMPGYDERCIETDPIEIDGVWYQDWIVVPLAPEELELKTQQQWIVVTQTQQALLSANITVLPSGNVVPKLIEFDYTLPADLNNVIIQSGNVTVDGKLALNPVVMVNDDLVDMGIDQAILSDNVTIMPGEAASAGIASIEESDGISTVVIASGNVEIVSPYPQEVIIPWTGPEATAYQYQAYIKALNDIKNQSNPFEIVWPANPFYGDLDAAAP